MLWEEEYSMHAVTLLPVYCRYTHYVHTRGGVLCTLSLMHTQCKRMCYHGCTPSLPLTSSCRGDHQEMLYPFVGVYLRIPSSGMHGEEDLRYPLSMPQEEHCMLSSCMLLVYSTRALHAIHMSRCIHAISRDAVLLLHGEHVMYATPRA